MPLRIPPFVALLPVAFGKLGCLDGFGNFEDFWYALKRPQGWKYSAMVGDGNLRNASTSLNESTSHLSRTLGQLYERSSHLSYALWNGEMEGEEVESPWAHAKGVVAFDGITGFWLTHSQPDFPGKGDPDFAAASDRYGQSYLCITIRADALEQIAKLAMVNRYFVYSSADNANIGGSFTNWAIDKKYGGEATVITTLSSAGGQAFTAFAKSAKWGDDLYEKLVAPALDADLYTETWQNGKGNLPSFCKDGDHKYNVRNVAAVVITKEVWKDTSDHSKWAVTPSKDIYCVGDINRQAGQFRRGGGTVCIHSPQIASTMKSAVARVQECGNEGFVVAV